MFKKSDIEKLENLKENFNSLSNILKIVPFVNNHMIKSDVLNNAVINDMSNNNPILCFDTESCKDIKDNSKERVYAWSLSNTDDDTVIYGYSLKEFIRFMYRYGEVRKVHIKNKKQNSINIDTVVFVHNLGWDIEFFKYCLSDLGFKYYSMILYDDGSTENEITDCNSFTITENDGQTYNSTIRIKLTDIVQKNGKKVSRFFNIKIYDFFKIIPQKLEDIGRKVIKIDSMFYKLGNYYDYNKIRSYNEELKPVEKAYIYNDVYILKEVINQYYIKNELNGFTASGIAFNNMLNFTYPYSKKKYEEFEKNHPQILDRYAVDLINKAYKGGLTMCNSKLKGKRIDKIGLSIDINSSYPSVMMYKPLPYGEPKYLKGKVKLTDEYNLGIQHIKFDGFKRKNDSNIGFIKFNSCEKILCDNKSLGIKKNDYLSTNIINNELISYGYDLVLTCNELELFNKIYDFYTLDESGAVNVKHLKKGVKFIDGLIFKSKIGEFGEFVNDCVKRKIQGKKDKNAILTLIAKTDMNSVYGKMGSGYERIIKTLTTDDTGLFQFTKKYINDDNDFDYLEKRKYYRPYALFVTSFGRLNLINSILEIERLYGEDNFIYCDTDSIYATITKEQLEKLNIETDKYKLGAWDIEKYFKSIKSLGAKKYIIYGRDFGTLEEITHIRKNREVKPRKYISYIKKYGKKYQSNRNICRCAGLPSNVRKNMTFENFHLGAEFNKLQKKKVIGGYRLINTSFTIKDFVLY